jgi:BirA family biotin operon repressor/biotin-[acetyl-CoA-carboxylase] ligase
VTSSTDPGARPSADLDAARIESALAARNVPWGRPLVVAPLTGSTNDDAKRAAKDGAPAGAAFIADAQTGGRGRLGRTWFSPPGQNLYASFVLRPALDAKRLPLITLTAGLAVADVVAARVAGHVGVKWPNDVYIDGRKVCGILSEVQIAGASAAWVVVGIGINVHTRAFPPEIADRATSLALAGEASPDRGALFVDLAAALFSRVKMLEEGNARAVIDALRARDELEGRPITVEGAPATAIGIADDGALTYRKSDGSVDRLVAGEVQIEPAPR